MSTRISSAIAICLLTGACDQNVGGSGAGGTGHKQTAVACATAGSADFKPLCSFDEAKRERGTVLTLHEPDGGFHRLLITKDGRGVVAADGAERAEVEVIGPGRIEVAIGTSRYRLPATIGPVTLK